MKCNECTFWVPLSDELHNFDGVKEDGIGVCYRYPPTCTGARFLQQQENRKKGEEWHFMGWMEQGHRPAVVGDNWCGEWKQKSE